MGDTRSTNFTKKNRSIHLLSHQEKVFLVSSFGLLSHPRKRKPAMSNRHLVVALLVVALLLCVTPSSIHAFVAPTTTTQTRRIQPESLVSLNLGGWFGSSRRKKKRQEKEAENFGSVASIVDSMGDLKTAQRVGQLTDSLVKELSTTVVEGTAMDGKVKVSFDCQQKPVGVTIEDGVVGEVDAATLSDAVTMAMQDAHSKSIERMDEKMKSLYAELGLSPTAA